MSRYSIPIKRKIKIITLNDLVEFNSVCTRAKGDVDIVCGRYIINGKSLLGLCSIDLTKEIEVILFSDDEEEIDSFLLRIGKWMVEE